MGGHLAVFELVLIYPGLDYLPLEPGVGVTIREGKQIVARGRVLERHTEDRVDEQVFWASLEYRICREFAGLPERRYQHFWCDGFLPNTYILDDASPRITGRCWICNGPVQSEWDFCLLLPGPVASRAEIEWSALHPAENVTRWMAFDEVNRYLEIEPAVAVPDLR